ncbi:MAG: helix-turn-helix domain-containing protein [Bacteroidetes bacterium]|nr:MAG: helix-turn-helix domain-containing protein [Bacteroidota bacterium]
MYRVAVILTDKTRKIIWVNDDFTVITGYTYDEVIGKIPGDVLQGPKTEQEAIEEIRRGLRALKPVKSAITNYRKNGQAYLCKLVIHPVFSEHRQLTNFIAFEVDGDIVENEEEIPLMRLDRKYQSSSLRGLDEIRLFTRITTILNSERLFLDPKLSLKSLADALGTNTKYLSQVVNHCSGHNFQNFLNRYRVDEFKRLVQENQHTHLTLFGLAQQCGFKNKSTFYKVFKDITKQTPKEFLAQLKDKD